MAIFLQHHTKPPLVSQKLFWSSRGWRRDWVRSEVCPCARFVPLGGKMERL